MKWNMWKLMMLSSVSALCGCIYFIFNMNDNNFGVVFWLFAWMILYVPMMLLKKQDLRKIEIR